MKTTLDFILSEIQLCEVKVSLSKLEDGRHACVASFDDYYL